MVDGLGCRHVGWSPLFRFVSIGSVEIVQHLLKSGAQCDVANVVGDVPLHMAASDDSPELVHDSASCCCADVCLLQVRILAQSGTAANFKGFVGRTPLHSAASAGAMQAFHGSDVAQLLSLVWAGNSNAA